MKIVHLTYSDMGGAGIAAKQLHLKLLTKGIESKLLTFIKLSEDIPEHYLFKPKQSSFFTKIGNKLKKIVEFFLPFLFKSNRSYWLKNQPKGFEYFSLPFSNHSIQNHPLVKNADIIHLHWVSDGMIDYEKFFITVNKPIVWTLHDMNPFTGGCHHSDGCMKFELDCKLCFQLKNTPNQNLSNKIFLYKKNALKELNKNNLQIIAPSNWLLQLSKLSVCFKKFNHYQIPNIISLPHSGISRNEARKKLNIDHSAKVILFVANTFDNDRKGMNTLLNALINIKEKERIHLLIIGKKTEYFNVNFQTTELGFVTDKNIIEQAYLAANVFLLPSVAENYPNTIVESLLCGTPVIASNVGGIPEQINDTNGILVNTNNPIEWTLAINSFFENEEKYNNLNISKMAKLKYNEDIIIEEHISVYHHFYK